jgi:hypothetical protein
MWGSKTVHVILIQYQWVIYLMVEGEEFEDIALED